MIFQRHPQPRRIDPASVHGPWARFVEGGCDQCALSDDEELVYLVSGYSKHSVLSAKTGDILWTDQIVPGKRLNSSLRDAVIHKGTLFVQPDDQWLAYDARTGEPRELQGVAGKLIGSTGDDLAFTDYGFDKVAEDRKVTWLVNALTCQVIELNDDKECVALRGQSALKAGPDGLVVGATSPDATDDVPLALAKGLLHYTESHIFSRIGGGDFVVYDWQGTLLDQIQTGLKMCAAVSVFDQSSVAVVQDRPGRNPKGHDLCGVSLEHGKILWTKPRTGDDYRHLSGTDEHVFGFRNIFEKDSVLVIVSREAGEIVDEVEAQGVFAVLPGKYGLIGVGKRTVRNLSGNPDGLTFL